MPEPKLQVRDYEEQRESGTTAMLIGGLFWAFAFLVMFFQPAAARLGKLTMIEIAGALVICGLVIFLVGMRIRSKAS